MEIGRETRGGIVERVKADDPSEGTVICCEHEILSRSDCSEVSNVACAPIGKRFNDKTIGVRRIARHQRVPRSVERVDPPILIYDDAVQVLVAWATPWIRAPAIIELNGLDQSSVWRVLANRVIDGHQNIVRIDRLTLGR